MKCEICKTKIAETFLGKMVGTTLKDAKGKQRTICFDCQKKFPKKQDALSEMGASVA